MLQEKGNCYFVSMRYHPKYTTINLQQLINRLLAFYSPVAAKQKCYFINAASHGLYVNTDAELLGTLVGSLFYVVARCSRDTPILVTAACYNERAAISLQCSSNADSYHILSGFQHVELLSKELNGFLEVNNYDNRETTITFNFASRHTNRVPGAIKNPGYSEKPGSGFILPGN